VEKVNNHSIDPDISVAETGEPNLTARELQVVRLMADGLTTKRIAGLLQISFKTASSHRGNILKKLQVNTAISAVRWAIRNGLIEP
jgi:two-component system, NarL family, response regulator NreC